MTSDNSREMMKFGKDVKRKQIMLHPDPVYDNPRLNRKYSYTDNYHKQEKERSKRYTFILYILYLD